MTGIIIPVHGAKVPEELLAIADALLEPDGSQGTVLSVVEVPEDRSLSEGALLARRRRTLLRRLAQSHPETQLRGEVRTARSVEEGVREAAQELRADLLLLSWKPGVAPKSLSSMVVNPPVDIAAIKTGHDRPVERVLVPVRGGPHARLALELAEAVATRHGAVLTLLHVRNIAWNDERQRREEEFYRQARDQVKYARTEEIEVATADIEDALRREAMEHDVVVMGAAAHDHRSSHLFGRIPESIAIAIPGTAVVVKTHEPVTAETFRLDSPITTSPHSEISQMVDRWFAENTFHSHEFRNIRYLSGLKEQQGLTISVALPALNEEKTIAKIITTIQRSLMERHGLIDELVVIDSDSTDRTAQIARGLGVPVYRHSEVLPEQGTYVGKGEALWKSLAVTKGDIVVWIDSDITSIHAKFVYGLVGPLLTQPHLGFIKGFYRRPLNLGGQLLTTGGGRVTELTARPLFNLFYPRLSGLVQPLAGEMAGRREVLESVPFFTGYGVETGLLIDILEQFGLRSIGQSDLEIRIHRNQSLLSLSKMAFAVVQTALKRVEQRGVLSGTGDISNSMKLIHYSPSELFLEVKEIEEHERPPIISVPEYRSLEREPAIAGGSP
ncbi:MAG: glucosyl-3-phosphoglycerate synthase [Chloroflexota bacterium]